jgi:hypothetical protein
MTVNMEEMVLNLSLPEKVITIVTPDAVLLVRLAILPPHVELGKGLLRDDQMMVMTDVLANVKLAVG